MLILTQKSLNLNLSLLENQEKQGWFNFHFTNITSVKSRKSKNEMLASSLGLTAADLDNLINHPIEVMTSMAEARGYTEEEVNILRDIRRRGKNLIAAHHCRNRKLGAVEVW